MLRAILIFVVGALVGANAVYFAMTRGDRCARCAPAATAADARTASATTAATPPTASSSTVGVPTAAAPTRTPGVTPPPVPPSPLPAATTDTNTPKLAMPLPGLTATQLRDTFAETRGGERAHEALDLIAPAGTPVLAVADGHIEK